MVEKENRSIGASSPHEAKRVTCTLARKRRKDILTSHRDTQRHPSQIVTVKYQVDELSAAKRQAGGLASVAVPTKKQKRTNQKRYDPEVPMTKEESIAWRKEARRARNRESAAASRQKVRDRIELLEKEVEGWKAKYATAIETIRQMEASRYVSLQSSPVGESRVENDSRPTYRTTALHACFNSPQQSGDITARTVVSPCSSPLLSPKPFIAQPPLLTTNNRNQERDSWLNKQHINEMTSRQA
uniref:BZIP domain-containing protein n=1 Tax=Helicotheca tamesis TaxID=374047 RepID=A0A7S2E3S1_9STRA